MPNNYLSVLYKHIIQVDDENVGLKVCVWGGGGAQTYHCPPIKKWGAGHMPPLPPPPPASYASATGTTYWHHLSSRLLGVWVDVLFSSSTTSIYRMSWPAMSPDPPQLNTSGTCVNVKDRRPCYPQCPTGEWMSDKSRRYRKKQQKKPPKKHKKNTTTNKQKIKKERKKNK